MLNKNLTLYFHNPERNGWYISKEGVKMYETREYFELKNYSSKNLEVFDCSKNMVFYANCEEELNLVYDDSKIFECTDENLFDSEYIKGNLFFQKAQVSATSFKKSISITENGSGDINILPFQGDNLFGVFNILAYKFSKNKFDVKIFYERMNSLKSVDISAFNTFDYVKIEKGIKLKTFHIKKDRNIYFLRLYNKDTTIILPYSSEIIIHEYDIPHELFKCEVIGFSNVGTIKRIFVKNEIDYRDGKIECNRKMFYAIDKMKIYTHLNLENKSDESGFIKMFDQEGNYIKHEILPHATKKIHNILFSNAAYYWKSKNIEIEKFYTNKNFSESE